MKSIVPANRLDSVVFSFSTEFRLFTLSNHYVVAKVPRYPKGKEENLGANIVHSLGKVPKLKFCGLRNLSCK